MIEDSVRQWFSGVCAELRVMPPDLDAPADHVKREEITDIFDHYQRQLTREAFDHVNQVFLQVQEGLPAITSPDQIYAELDEQIVIGEHAHKAIMRHLYSLDHHRET